MQHVLHLCVCLVTVYAYAFVTGKPGGLNNYYACLENIIGYCEIVVK